MTKSFSQLRKQSSNTNFDALQKKLKDATGGKKDYSDDRFWRAQQDKAGNAQAVIRFLPVSKADDLELPFVKLYSFGFKGPTGQWFIENCPQTIGLPCPVLEANNALWDSGIDANKDIARKRKRRTSYISNIYVVSDPANPENEGKVFLFKYGQKVFEKILASLSPQFEGDDPVDVFDFWKGANFKLRIVKKDGFANYDNSLFDAPTELFAGEEDDKYEAIWNQQHTLGEFVAEDQFKSYDELKAKFERIIGGTTLSAASTTVEEDIAASGPTVDDDALDAEVASLNISDDTAEDDLEAFKGLVE